MVVTQKLEFLLRDWGQWNAVHMDHANEYGSNVLYAAGLMGGRVQDKSDGHKILDVDTPLRFRQVDRAVRRLAPIDSLVVRVFYCAPIKPDGLLYTKPQLAILTHISLSAFEESLKRARKLLKGMLG
jgi:hypothetical protein